MAADIPELTLNLTRHAQVGYRLEMRFVQPGSQSEVDPAAGQDLRFDFDPNALDTAASAEAYGRTLAGFLFKDELVRTAFKQAQAVAQSLDLPLRVRLQAAPDAREIHALHWETLYDSQGGQPLFSGEKVLFSRFLSSAAWDKVSLRPKRALRALLVVANPSDLDVYGLEAVDVSGETGRARQALGEIQAEVLPSPATQERASLEAMINRLRQGSYDILYIVAHGRTRKEESFILLENEQGEAARVSGEELTTQLLTLDKLPILVALIACESAGEAASPALSAIGPRLAEAGVPAVLAMQGKISIPTAGKFAPVFFQELADEGVLDRAAGAARNAVRDQPDFWMPALFTRLKNNLIYGEAEGVQVRPPEIQRLNRSLIWIGAVIAVLVFVIGGLIYAQSRPKQVSLISTATPSRMNKDFNVAIADIPVLDAQGNSLDKPDGHDLAQFLKDRLEAEISQSFANLSDNLVPEVWGYELTGKVEGATPQERYANAEAMAKSKNIHVLIYGVIQQDGDQGSYTPEFYVNAQAFPRQAPEITGATQLGRQMDIGNPFERSAAAAGGNPALLARSKALSLLTIGLTYYAYNDYANALKYFSLAAQDPKWLKRDGKEVAYILSGNARTNLAYVDFDFSDLASALADYEQAWTISRQTYGRAMIGKASVAYLQALTDPAAASDPNFTDQKLAESEDQFNQALQLPNQPAEYNIPEKAALGLGQIYQTRGQIYTDAGQAELAKTAFQRAAAEYQKIVDAYLGGAKNAVEQAIHAYANLGLLAAGYGDQETQAGNLQAANEQYEQAIEPYLKAYELASPYFQAEYAAAIGRISFQQGVNARDLGDQATAVEKFKRAEKYLKEGLRLAERLSRQQLIDEFQPVLDDLQKNYQY